MNSILHPYQDGLGFLEIGGLKRSVYEGAGEVLLEIYGDFDLVVVMTITTYQMGWI